MPFVYLDLSTPRIEAIDKTELARFLTERLEVDLKKKRELTVAQVRLEAETDWTVAGDSLGPDEAIFFVRAVISADSNSSGECAAFIRSVYEGLSERVGSTSPLSYVVIDELPRERWGYGGRTQRDRAAAEPGSPKKLVEL